MAFNKLKGLVGDVKNAANQYLSQENVERLVGDVKNTANKYLNQENVDKIVGEVKNAAMDVKNNVTEYMNQTPDQRAIAKLEKEKEAHLKQASYMLSTDFRQAAGGYKFYINNNYDEPYSQSQWLELYKKLSAEDDPKAFAPMYNAIVVDEGGYIVRRGLEPLHAKVITFVPGKNDEVTHTYAYEPYTYKKNPRAVTRTQTGHYRTPAPTAQPANAPLGLYEKAEIDKAKREYEQAKADVSYQRRRGSSNLAYYEAREARANAEYMRVLAKYAGRK